MHRDRRAGDPWFRAGHVEFMYVEGALGDRTAARHHGGPAVRAGVRPRRRGRGRTRARTGPEPGTGRPRRTAPPEPVSTPLSGCIPAVAPVSLGCAGVRRGD
ncbi:hypothetical protein GCM10010206_35890 [Streptomyces cinerochromogenes]|nr:hypothetical protein GCM10010206_35890 [Streptomyces cinerochromogenes]